MSKGIVPTILWAVLAVILIIDAAIQQDRGDKQIKSLSMPEEWPIAKDGDTLIMYERGDIIHIGFYHPFRKMRPGDRLLILKQ